jgi:hypothetical protein
MTNYTIDTAQEFLTMISENRVKRILDVRTLMERHPVRAVVSVLEELAKQKESILEELLREDKTSSLVNDAIIMVFILNLYIVPFQKNVEVQKA